MIPYVFISVTTLIYTVILVAVIKELLAHPSKEERRENQSFQLILSSTILYITLICKAIQLNANGILTLM